MDNFLNTDDSVMNILKNVRRIIYHHRIRQNVMSIHVISNYSYHISNLYPELHYFSFGNLHQRGIMIHLLMSHEYTLI